MNLHYVKIACLREFNYYYAICLEVYLERHIKSALIISSWYYVPVRLTFVAEVYINTCMLLALKPVE